jgi:hypothetical protein
MLINLIFWQYLNFICKEIKCPYPPGYETDSTATVTHSYSTTQIIFPVITSVVRCVNCSSNQIVSSNQSQLRDVSATNNNEKWRCYSNQFMLVFYVTVIQQPKMEMLSKICAHHGNIITMHQKSNR